MSPLLLPVAAVQGAWLRSTLRMAEPATGPTVGTVGAGAGEPLHIAVLGDSTAAGCGVETHDQGFPGCLARELATRTGRRVAWQAVGQFGATARRVRHRLLPRVAGELDLAVVLAGGNDVLARRPPAEWAEDLAAIVDGLSTRAGRVVVTGIPPFAQFPSLPGTLRRYLGERAAAMDALSRQVCNERPQSVWASSLGVPPAEFFAHDGFHPSAAGYRRWARMVADQLLS